MILPEDFQFSASSLQDFVDCPRRFYLRHIRQLRHPAAEAEPLGAFEQHVQRAVRFHQLVRQHRVGIPPEILEATIADDMLGTWWENYRAHAPANLPTNQFTEITLTAPLGGRRLVARYDLLAVDDRAVIVDWKTTHIRPSRASLESRLQTIVYRYLLAQAGAHLNHGQTIAPGEISLVYWFTQFPEQPEVFTYDTEQFQRDATHLDALATDIEQRSEDDFPLTDDTDFCHYCAYRSLNGRGAQAGDYFSAEYDDQRDVSERSARLDTALEIDA